MNLKIRNQTLIAAALSLIPMATIADHAVAADVRLVEGQWTNGTAETSCAPASGGGYDCEHSGSSADQFVVTDPVEPQCIETFSDGGNTNVDDTGCIVTFEGSTFVQLNRDFCIGTPKNSPISSNGTATIYSEHLSQSYTVYIKIVLKRGVGTFNGVGNFSNPDLRVEITGSFVAQCNNLAGGNLGPFSGSYHIDAVSP